MNRPPVSSQVRRCSGHCMPRSGPARPGATGPPRPRCARPAPVPRRHGPQREALPREALAVSWAAAGDSPEQRPDRSWAAHSYNQAIAPGKDQPARGGLTQSYSCELRTAVRSGRTCSTADAAPSSYPSTARHRGSAGAVCSRGPSPRPARPRAAAGPRPVRTGSVAGCRGETGRLPSAQRVDEGEALGGRRCSGVEHPLAHAVQLEQTCPLDTGQTVARERGEPTTCRRSGPPRPPCRSR